MKTLTIDRNSWHYRLAKFGKLYDEGGTDLCSYFWALVRGVVSVPFSIIVGVLAGFLLFAPILALIVWAVEGRYPVEIFALFGSFLYCISAFIGFVVWFVLRGVEKIGSTPPMQLVKAGYRGWKEKTCVLVEVKGGDGA